VVVIGTLLVEKPPDRAVQVEPFGLAVGLQLSFERRQTLGRNETHDSRMARADFGVSVVTTRSEQHREQRVQRPSTIAPFFPPTLHRIRANNGKIERSPSGIAENAPQPTLHLAGGRRMDLTLNGEERTFDTARSDTLLDVLRRNGLTGAKLGCDTGACGFCTVTVDGEPAKACIKPAGAVDGATVETIEHLGSQDDLHPVQAAFVDNAALQCGFCIPGMIMRSKVLLEENPDPTEEEIREGLAENLCRCTGYEKIVDAVADAAIRMDAELAADGGDPR